MLSHHSIFVLCISTSLNGHINAVDCNAWIIKVYNKTPSAADNACTHLVCRVTVDIYGNFGRGKYNLALYKIFGGKPVRLAYLFFEYGVERIKLLAAYSCVEKNTM